MSVNKYQPHVFVLPEDDANLQIANGFHLRVDWNRQRQMQVLPVAGGWNHVLNLFQSEHVMEMDRCPSRYMILLIDFDGRKDRLESVNAIVPEHLAGRVFILGVWSEPEALKVDLGGYEYIGSAMADDCRQDTHTTWGHQLLNHNEAELDRLREHILPILFEPM